MRRHRSYDIYDFDFHADPEYFDSYEAEQEWLEEEADRRNEERELQLFMDD